ncbi:hypothetical protein LTS17_005395 [Exophiala oligosperma]
MSLTYDPDIARALSAFPATQDSQASDVGDVKGVREGLSSLTASLTSTILDPGDVEIKSYTVKAADGHDIPITGFRKMVALSSDTPGPAVLHLHGGGYIALSVKEYVMSIKMLVSTSAIPFFSVDYRLAPENPFPTALEDAYTAVSWLSETSTTLNVDPARIAIYGDSAGGGLAAALAIVCRDRHLNPPITKQILIYPMLDDRTTHRNGKLDPFLLWSVDNNIVGWRAYLGKLCGTDRVSSYAAPARARSLDGLPETYLDVGGLDLFREENIAYVARLTEANVPVEFHLFPGVPHAFELLAPEAEVTRKALATRLRALMSF